MTLMSSISITVARQATAIVTTGLIRSRSVIGLLVSVRVRSAAQLRRDPDTGGRTGRRLVVDVVGGTFARAQDADVGRAYSRSQAVCTGRMREDLRR